MARRPIYMALGRLRSHPSAVVMGCCGSVGLLAPCVDWSSSVCFVVSVLRCARSSRDECAVAGWALSTKDMRLNLRRLLGTDAAVTGN